MVTSKKILVFFYTFVYHKYQFQINFNAMSELNLPEVQKNQVKNDLKALYKEMDNSHQTDILTIVKPWHKEFERLLKLIQNNAVGFQDFGEGIKSDMAAAERYKNSNTRNTKLYNAIDGMKWSLKEAFYWIFKENIEE